MKKVKMHNKARAWQLQGGHPVLATLLCIMYPQRFMVILVFIAICYDFYLLWVHPKFALLRRKPDDFKLKNIITCLVSIFGLVAAVRVTGESNSSAAVFCMLMFLVAVYDQCHYMELFSKGKR